MTEVMIRVCGARAVMSEKAGLLTAGMVGAVARFSFDGAWNGLSRVAVFRCGSVTRDAVSWDGDSVKIPAEVLREGRLFAGVEGRNADGSVVIPTVWAECGTVLAGANASGDPSTDPGLEVWAQILGMIGQLSDLQTADKSTIVAAINEALKSGGGSVDEAAVERIVEEYLREHPVETDPVDMDAIGQMVEAYLREHPPEVVTDTELLAEGIPADAYVTGRNIRAIGSTLNATRRQVEAMDLDMELIRSGAIRQDIGDVVAGAMINQTYGNFITGKTEQLGASEQFIPLVIGRTYEASTTGAGFNLYFYGEDQSFLRALYEDGSTKKDTVVFVNAEYHYARVGSWWNSTMTQEVFDTISLAMVSEGDSLESLRRDIDGIQLPEGSGGTAHPKANGWIESNHPVWIDTVAKTLTFGPNAFIGYGGEKTNVADMSFDISTLMSGGFAYFHPATKTITRTYAEGAVFLGSVWSPAFLHGLHVDKDKVLVDGMPVTFTGRYLRKTVHVLGDSMTEGGDYLPEGTKLYHQWLGQLCGFTTVNNYGVGGSCISPKSDDVVSWDDRASFLERYADMADGADAVVVMGCTNDWTYGHELGAITDTGTNTFYGAMKALCEGLRAKFPTADLYFFSSPQSDYTKRRASSLSGEWAGNDEGYNRKGLKLEDYAAAMGEVCGIYGIPFCDMGKGLWWGPSGVLGVYDGVNYQHTPGLYGIDSLHPNHEGHKKIALKMAGAINSGG